MPIWKAQLSRNTARLDYEAEIKSTHTNEKLLIKAIVLSPSLYE